MSKFVDTDREVEEFYSVKPPRRAEKPARPADRLQQDQALK